MPRIPERTHRVNRDHLARMSELFGTSRNAYELLGLERDISHSVFVRAWKWYTVRKEEADAIHAAWARWCNLFLGVLVEDVPSFSLSYVDEHDVQLPSYS